MDIFLDPTFSSYFAESPIVLVDIGASGGLQSHWKKAQKHLKVIGFEPDEREFHRLKAAAPAGMVYLNTALYSEKARLQFNLAREQKVSSIFKPNAAFLAQFPGSETYEVLRTVELDADTLDHQLELNALQDIDFIKADTQGAELAILKGASSALTNHVFGLEIEVEFAPIYEGQPLFAEVDEYVRSFGFQLMDLRPFTWKRKVGRELGGPKGQLIFGDSLYFKTVARLMQDIAQLDNEAARRQKVLRCMAVCLLYGYVDYCAAIWEAAKAMFSQAESQAMERFFAGSKRKWNGLPDFRGRWRAADILYRLHRIADPTYSGWSVGGRNIGNVD
jgi:FkbM family methyltransferase